MQICLFSVGKVFFSGIFQKKKLEHSGYSVVNRQWFSSKKGTTIPHKINVMILRF